MPGALSDIDSIGHFVLCGQVVAGLDGAIAFFGCKSWATGFPITYAVAGRQFVAVSTGSGGAFLNLSPEVRPSAGSNLLVFALPDSIDR